MAKKVELRRAFEWACEDCGRTNYVSGLHVDAFHMTVASKRLAEFMAELMGADPDAWKTRGLTVGPDAVTCGHCGATFETED